MTPLRPYYPQLDLDLGRLPAGSQPVSTSEDAADKLTPEALHRRRLAVLRLFATVPKSGLTADEVEEAFGLGHNATSPRVTDLLNMGFLLRYDGKDGRPYIRRKTRQGGTAFVHVISVAGRRACE